MVGFHKPFFRRLFLYCFCILFLVSSLFFFSFLRQLTIHNKAIEKQENEAQIKLLTRIIDDKFAEMDRIGTQLSQSSWVRKASSPFDILHEEINVLDRENICSEMSSYNAIVRIVKSTALILPQREIIIDRVSFWEQERYFQSVSLPAEQISDAILQALPENYSALTLLSLQDVPQAQPNDFLLLKQLNYSNPPKQVLFFYVDGRLFEDNMLKNWEDSLIDFQILQGGQSIYRYQNQTAQAQHTFSAQSGSEFYSWSYEFTVPAKGAGQMGQGLLRVGLWALLLLINLLLAYGLARLLYRPFFTLQKRLKVDSLEEGENEFKAIERSFLSLRNERNNFEQLSSQYYNMALANFFTSLLQGSFDQTTLEEELEQFNMPIRDDMQFLTIVLEYPEPTGKEQIAYDFLKLSEWAGDRHYEMYLTENASQNLVLILAGDSGTVLIRRANECRHYCAEELAVTADFLCGIPYQGFVGISKSYYAAAEQSPALEMPVNNRYYYPIDWEVQLINQLRIRREDVVLNILHELRAENGVRKLSLADNRQVVSLVMETLLRVSAEMENGIHLTEVQSEFQTILLSEDAAWPWDYVENFAGLLCGRMERAQDPSQEKGKKLLEYVNRHYCDSSLSQQDLADHFEISRSMVSKLFKGTAKVNFIDYLHLLRVQRAKEYFDGGNYDIMDVAQKTGYENEITFKRAFMRIESITPRQYVQKVKAQRPLK